MTDRGTARTLQRSVASRARRGVIACLLAVLVGSALLDAASSDAKPTTALGVHHYEYVVNGSQVYVYDIDNLGRLLQTFSLPYSGPPQGVEADAANATLYVSYGGEGGAAGTGSIIAYDLLTGHVVWQKSYRTGVDSIALSPDGRTLYVPVGELSNNGRWLVVDAATGNKTGSIAAGGGAHDTCVGADGKFVYLGGVDYPYLEVASTATNRVVRKLGPLHGPGVRPFAINHDQTLAFTTARSFLGFQVSSITTGKVLYSVSPPGFSFDPTSYSSTPDHGISLSPGSRELYLIDTVNGYVHVFDLSGLPASPPRDVADIKLLHAPSSDGWLEHSADGRFVFVGNSGDVIDTQSRTVVSYLPQLNATTEFLEIDWRDGRPINATARCSYLSAGRCHPQRCSSPAENRGMSANSYARPTASAHEERDRREDEDREHCHGGAAREEEADSHQQAEQLGLHDADIGSGSRSLSLPALVTPPSRSGYGPRQ